MLSRCQEQQRAGLPQGPLFSIRAISAVTVVSVLTCRGRGSWVGPDQGGVEDSVPGCGLRAIQWFSLK